MISVNIDGNHIYLRDIKAYDLPYILKWYNQVEEFMYATGIDKFISLTELSQKYKEYLHATNEFFIGINMKKDNKIVGVIKGELRNKKEVALWINTIVIDKEYQNNGFGKLSINMLLTEFKSKENIKKAYLAVAENNKTGLKFWKGLGFEEMVNIKGLKKLKEGQQNIFVMEKELL